MSQLPALLDADAGAGATTRHLQVQVKWKEDIIDTYGPKVLHNYVNTN
jgi:hypothetical protein